MQNQTSGGIFTHITPDDVPGESDTNTETTAFVILGMTSIRSHQAIPEFELTALVVLSVTFMLSVAILRRTRQIASGRKLRW